MTEVTPAPAGVATPAPVNTALESGESRGSAIEISSSLPTSGIIFPAEKSISIGPIPKVGSTIDFFGGTTGPDTESFQPKISVPDELSDPIRSTPNITPLDPFETSRTVADFFSPVDAIDIFLGNKPISEKNLKQNSNKLQTKTWMDGLKNAKAPQETSFTKHVEEVVQKEIIAPILNNFADIESTLTEETTMQSSEISKAVKTTIVDAPHAQATVHALLEVGIKNAPEIVGRAMTLNLHKEKIEANVLVQIQARPLLSFDQKESYVFQLKFVNKNKHVPKQVFVIDADAQEAQRVAFDEAIEMAAKENMKKGIGTVSGKDVLGKFSKKEEQKSQPLENTLIDDGALAETTIEARNFLPNLGSNLKKYFRELIQKKPPIREDVQGKQVVQEDVARVFNGKKVISKNS